MKRQDGQSIVEAVLLLVALMGVLSLVRMGLTQSEFIKKMVGGPWNAVAMVAESGVWQDGDDIEKHPNSHTRWLTLQVQGAKRCD